MQQLNFDIDRQMRWFAYASCGTAALNFLIALLMRLPCLPWFYAGSVVFFLGLGRLAGLKHFVLSYVLNFFQVMCQAVVFIYVLGDDCGIQMYLFALLIPCHYIRMTRHFRRFQRLFILAVCLAAVVFYMVSDEVLDVMLHPLTRVSESQEFFFTLINLCLSLVLLLFVTSRFFGGYQRSYRELLSRNDLLREEVRTDTLTGLYNRRGMEPLLSQAYQDWSQGHASFSVALGDIDLFKQVNDRYGHDAGDAVLRHISGLLAARLPAGAAVCRWGGEEFLFLFPCSGEEAAAHLEQCLSALWETPARSQSQPLPVTMTFGVAQAEPGLSLEALLKLADQRLYMGKQAGRCRIVCRSICVAGPAAAPSAHSG